MAVLLAACAMEGGDGGTEASGDGEGGLVASVLNVPAEPDSVPAALSPTYQLGESEFRFSIGTLLQTWPVMFVTPPRFARIAVQMPAEVLAPELVGITDRVQVDVLEASQIPDADAVLQSAFADWVGRETAPAQSAYKFTVTSNRGATGNRIAYLRLHQKIGLDSLAPFQPQEGAPIYLVAVDDAHVTTLITCQPVPAAYGGGDHCSLRRRVSETYGYRVLFPQDLLGYWQVIDRAAADYVAAAKQ